MLCSPMFANFKILHVHLIEMYFVFPADPTISSLPLSQQIWPLTHLSVAATSRLVLSLVSSMGVDPLPPPLDFWLLGRFKPPLVGRRSGFS